MCDAKCKAVNDVNKADDLCEDCREGSDEHFEAEDEDLMCGSCAGSGEGMHDGTTCLECGGTGSAGEADRRRDYEDGKADYLYDQWKDERNN